VAVGAPLQPHAEDLRRRVRRGQQLRVDERCSNRRDRRVNGRAAPRALGPAGGWPSRTGRRVPSPLCGACCGTSSSASSAPLLCFARVLRRKGMCLKTICCMFVGRKIGECFYRQNQGKEP
jgi:hypothetical protein